MSLQDSPLAAVVTVAASSLVVAVVCFGALESTGATESSTGAFTGSIAGFLAAGGLLSTLYLRARRPADPISASTRAKADVVFEDVVKVLDLREVEADDVAVLTDYRLLTKETADLDRYVFEYGTNGTKLEGRSLSHPSSSEWRDVSGDALRPGEARHTHQSYELELNLRNVARGERTHVIHELRFHGGFAPGVEWLHTHLEEPTGRLAFVLLFPAHQPCRTVRGETKGSGRTTQWREPTDQPVIMQDGQVVYWRVEGPDEEQYRLEWTW